MSEKLVCELGDVADIIRGISFPTSAKRRSPAGGLIACLRTTNVQDTVEWSDLLYVEEKYVRNERQLIQQGDILISMSNSLDLVGKCALVGADPPLATFGTFIAVIRPHALVDARYVFSAMRSPAFKAHIRDAASTTTNISNINASKLLCAPITVLGKTARSIVVSKIDELFSSIDEGERALERVRKLVERYRQSVLKAAVTGELTREWRKQHADELESGEALLTRILEARRKAWETAELAKMTAKHKGPLNDLWKKKYRAPATSDTSDLPELPHGWCWATADQFCSLVTDGEHLTPPRTESGVYLLSARNVRNGEIILHDVDYISEETHTALSQRLCINAGDVLLSCSGSVGRSCVVPIDLTFSLVRSVAVLKTVFVRSQYVSLALRSQLLQDQIRSKSTQTAQANIFQGSIRSLVFPVPPLHEQDQIISECMAQIDSAHRTENEIGLFSTGSSRLRSSTLNLAFRGGLVAHDAEDEPASVLLERIAAERTASIKRPATKQVRKRKAKA